MTTSSAQAALNKIRKLIDGLPHADRVRVYSIADIFRDIVKGGDTHAALALTLVYSEVAAK